MARALVSLFLPAYPVGGILGTNLHPGPFRPPNSMTSGSGWDPAG